MHPKDSFSCKLRESLSLKQFRASFLAKGRAEENSAPPRSAHRVFALFERVLPPKREALSQVLNLQKPKGFVISPNHLNQVFYPFVLMVHIWGQSNMLLQEKCQQDFLMSFFLAPGGDNDLHGGWVKVSDATSCVGVDSVKCRFRSAW